MNSFPGRKAPVRKNASLCAYAFFVPTRLENLCATMWSYPDEELLLASAIQWDTVGTGERRLKLQERAEVSQILPIEIGIATGHGDGCCGQS